MKFYITSVAMYLRKLCTLGDFHRARTSKVGHASPPNTNTLTWESGPNRRLMITLSGNCLMSAGVACNTETNCLLKSTWERDQGDRFTLVGTISRQAPEDKAMKIYRIQEFKFCKVFSQNLGESHPVPAHCLRHIQPMKSAKDKATEVPSLDNQGWQFMVVFVPA